MREIKFRAWDPFNEVMYFGKSRSLSIFFGRVEHDLIGENGTIVMQYTGLKDKNGEEIYEGDIVGKKTRDTVNKQTIVWDNDIACFDWETTTNDDWPDGFSGFLDEYEVIGNTYENKELLSG